MEVHKKVWDIVGVGFGPSNLSLAIAIDEWKAEHKISLDTLFLEKQSGFVWHQGMLLPGSTMQISFLKDLVSLRNPLSRYTFINYLHKKGRLSDFVNLQTFFPSRIEFNDYLSWVAADIAVPVNYGEEVVSIEPCDGGLVKVVAHNQAGLQQHMARNVVLAAGGRGFVPKVFSDLGLGANVFHSSQYLHAMERLPSRGNFAVVGAGQSAAEIFLDLNQRSPMASVDLYCRSQALRVSDDSPFVNEIFAPSFVDEVYGRSKKEREEFLRSFSFTNYSVADRFVVEKIYDLIYQQQVSNKTQLEIKFSSEIVSANIAGERVVLQVEHQTPAGIENYERQYDAVFLATGYERATQLKLLESFQFEDPPEVSRHYRLSLTKYPDCNIYLQGGCESSHGLSDTLLSILPARSMEIFEDIVFRGSTSV